MKVEITIAHHPEDSEYVASARVGEMWRCGIGSTAEEAEADLVSRIKLILVQEPAIVKTITIDENEQL